MLAVGDVIRLPHPDGEGAAEPEYEILALPSGNVSRARATTLYRQITSNLS